MTLDQLESFVCIATGAGFKAASRKLHRSQPAISRRIGQLEQALDAKLFERVGRTSMRIKVEAWRRNRYGDDAELVTAGTFTFVAIDDQRRPRELPP